VSLSVYEWWWKKRKGGGCIIGMGSNQVPASRTALVCQELQIQQLPATCLESLEKILPASLALVAEMADRDRERPFRHQYTHLVASSSMHCQHGSPGTIEWKESDGVFQPVGGRALAAVALLQPDSATYSYMLSLQ